MYLLWLIYLWTQSALERYPSKAKILDNHQTAELPDLVQQYIMAMERLHKVKPPATKLAGPPGHNINPYAQNTQRKVSNLAWFMTQQSEEIFQ